MQNLIARELKAHFKSWLILSIAAIAFVTMIFAEFSAYYQNPEMAAVIEALPQALVDAFSMGDTNLTSLSGFVAVAFVFLLLFQSVYSALLGHGILAKEERDKTAEFLMVLPISRVKILWGKTISALIYTTLLTAVIALSLHINAIPYSRGPHYQAFYFRLLFVLWFISVTFLCMGLALAGLMKNHKTSGIISIGIVLVMYLLSIISSLSQSVEFLSVFTFFKYYEAVDLINPSELKIYPLMILSSVNTFSLLFLFRFYPIRDLRL